MSELGLASTMNRRDLLLKAVVITGAALVLDSCGGNQVARPAGRTRERLFAEVPTWEQDFTQMPDGGLDPRFWNMETGNLIPSYNKEAETLTNRSENVRIQDGLLIIEARKEQEPVRGKHITSGRVTTEGKFSLQYGKLEVDLKVPQGVGTWPAAWLLPDGAKYKPHKYGINPSSDNAWALNGEIDFFEAVGAEPGRVYPDVHSYNSVVANRFGTKHLTLPRDTEEFNTFGVELTPGNIAFTHNGRIYHQIKKASDSPRDWPYDQPYYLILNLAMGGSWGGEKKKEYPPDGIQGDGPWQLAVKGVRYYEAAHQPV